MIDWHQAIDQLRPYVVAISTPDGSGTGWLLSRSAQTGLCGIVTAAHVIDHAHFWEEPIRLTHYASGKTVLLREPQRAISLFEETDLASLILETGDFPFPETPLQLVDQNHFLKPGVEIGWLGFPAVARSTLSFFGGRISAYIEEQSSYLIDGVAINGVSGGPAFRLYGDRVELMGVVSAYIANRATGETLPGVAVVRDVERLHEVLADFRSLDEAKEEETPVLDSQPPASEVVETPTRRPP